MDNKPKVSQGQGLIQVTSENWQQKWAQLPVRADDPQGSVIAAGTPAISSLNAGTGSRENGITVFEFLILNLLEFYGVEWSDIQIRECAEIMHSEYHWLHLAELKQFSIRAKAGSYNRKEVGNYGKERYDGKLYGKMAPAVLMKWIAEYADESIEARSMMNWDKKPQIEAPGAIDVSARLTGFVTEHFGNGLDSQEQEQAYREAKIMQAQKNAIRQQEFEEQLKKQQP